MALAFHASMALSIAAFLVYGLTCVFSLSMVEEFERFGLARFRRLVGALEVAGALGLLLGYVYPVLVIAASGGLSLLMLLGVATRIRVRDPLVTTLPALVLLLVNVFLVGYAIVEPAAR